MQLLDRDRVQRILEVQLMAASAFQSKDAAKAHERLLVHAFPEIAIRKAVREAHTKRVAESLEDVEFSFGLDGEGNLSLEQTKDGS